ncbi:hypothetical protein BY996DRAFT_4576857 [Phakopsora pachyrhizi]|nr:hypothetical protein BY996DRAFT_4576857 [Phakopsora pachyrhizi]
MFLERLLSCLSTSDPHPASLIRSHLLPNFYSYIWSFKNPVSGSSPRFVSEKSILECLKVWYFGTDPLESGITICLVISLVTWLLGEFTGDLSQVDRLWTILPVLYSAHFVILSPKLDDRMRLLLMCHIIWSIRLTTNTFRRGFFELKEDYRWKIVKRKFSKWQLKLLNVIFVSLFQNILLFSTSLPQYLLLTTKLYPSRDAKNSNLNWIDFSLLVCFIVVLAIETIADEQQQTYQIAKRKNDHQRFFASALKRGFVTNGLWYYSRHPNVACEQLIWYILYGFTIVATRSSNQLCFSDLINYTLASPILMSILLYSSTVFTESISSSKCR